MEAKLIPIEDLKDIDSKSGAWARAYLKANVDNFNTLVKVEYIPQGVEDNEYGEVRLICRDCGKTYQADEWGGVLKSKISYMINHLRNKHNLSHGALVSKVLTYSDIHDNEEQYNITTQEAK